MRNKKQLLTNQWNNVSTDDAYNLSVAEFKGMTIQALQDIRSDVHEIKREISITRYISMSIAGIAGIVSGLFGSKLK